jgi:hypothetical protein
MKVNIEAVDLKWIFDEGNVTSLLMLLAEEGKG